jgi:hypothetical protein
VKQTVKPDKIKKASTRKVKQDERGIIIDAFHGYPERHREQLTGLLNALRQTGRDVEVQTARLDADILSQCGLLVIVASEKQYIQSELAAIGAYVKSGGALLICGGKGLIGKLPISIGIESQDHGVYGPGWKPIAKDFPEHEITRAVKSLVCEASRVLTVTAPAIALGHSGADTWLELVSHGDRVKTPEDKAGPFVVLAATEWGLGRVFCSGSHSVFYDGHVNQGRHDNLRLMRQAIRWLLTSDGSS